RNDPEETAADVAVQEHDFTRVLHDLVRRSDARNSRWLALKHRVRLNLFLVQVFYLRDKLRLVLWERAGNPPNGGTDCGAVAARRCSLSLRAIENADRTASQFLRSDETERVVIPCSIEIGFLSKGDRSKCVRRDE